MKRIFLSLPKDKLDRVFFRYSQEHGDGATKYARSTYSKWKSEKVGMSGAIAERLLNLVPVVLEPAIRFELVRKLRKAHMHKEHRQVQCSLTNWRAELHPILNDVISASQRFELPKHVLDRIKWLTDGDTEAAHRLLAAAEQEDAVVRVRFLRAEFDRIQSMICRLGTTPSITHTIELPQGAVQVRIVQPTTSIWKRIGDIFQALLR